MHLLEDSSVRANDRCVQTSLKSTSRVYFLTSELLAIPTTDSGLAERGKSDTYSQTVGKVRPTKALDKYSVYISLATPSR